MGRLTAVGLLAVFSTLGCGDDASEPSPGAPDCARACKGTERCELESDESCEFANPSPWLLFDAMLTEATPPDPDTRIALFVVPTGLAGRVEPISVSEGAFDVKFWATFDQSWSPDGGALVFDANLGWIDEGWENRLFITELGKGLPGEARRVPDLPEGTQLVLGDWDAESRAFTVEADEDIYVVRRDDGELVVTLPVSGGGVFGTSLCAGGEYLLTAGEGIEILRVDGTERRTLSGVANYAVSPDGKQVAVVDGASEEGTYSVELLPCSEDDRKVQVHSKGAGSPESVYPWFSPDSRYLVVETDEGFAGYWDVNGSTSVSLFPEGTSMVDHWAKDGSYAVLVTDQGDLLRFDPVTGETSFIGVLDGSTLEYSGDHVWLEHADPDFEEPSTYSLVDLREPDAPVFELAPEDGALFESLVVTSPNGSHFAHLVPGEDEPRVHLVDLETKAEVVYEFPGALGLELGAFSGDGAGLLVADRGGRFRVYWLPVDPEDDPASPRLVHEASAGDLLTPQPWP